MTITLTSEEAQQVLDALADAAWCVQHNNLPPDEGHDWDKELELLRWRLAQPEPEPVAWMHSLTGGGWQVVPEKLYPTDQPLYTAPPQRNWQGLTDEEWETAHWSPDFRAGAKWVEAKLKEKNT